MSTKKKAVSAAVALFLCEQIGSFAFARAVAGNRTFPATLGIDDPGVGVIGDLRFYFDDIFPHTLGSPIFGGDKT